MHLVILFSILNAFETLKYKLTESLQRPMIDVKLLKFGYFPKELPPPFNTIDLADNIQELRIKWNKALNNLTKLEKNYYRETNSCKYNIPKNEFIRRALHIPNPLCQIQLTQLISSNWTEIQDKINKSKISYSKPFNNPFLINRAVITKNNFSDFTKERLIISADMLFEIKTDISRFYNSIYTHSIPWAIHGKRISKENRNDLSLLGNKIDKLLREGNFGQTVGIPIGPDTSLIFAEIIHSEIDNRIQSLFPKIKFLRFMDDLYAYCDNLAEAEKFIKKYQILLSEYQLELNEEKTTISHKVFEFENKWTSQLSTFKFRTTNIGQATDIERFASLVFDLYRKFPNESILLYAAQILNKLNIVTQNSWKIYQAILFKILLIEPKTIEIVTKIFIKNEKNLDNKSFKNILNKILDENIGKNHHYEISWVLWIMKEFSFKLTKSRADLISKSEDNFSILLLLDMKSKGLVSNQFNIEHIKETINREDLFGENWILIYESAIKKWIEFDEDPISKNKFFTLMKDLNITFYNNSYTSRLKGNVVEESAHTFDYNLHISNNHYDFIDNNLYN